MLSPSPLGPGHLLRTLRLLYANKLESPSIWTRTIMKMLKSVNNFRVQPRPHRTHDCEIPHVCLCLR